MAFDSSEVMVTCEACNKPFSVKGIKMHKIRAHEKSWSTRKKQDAA